MRVSAGSTARSRKALGLTLVALAFLVAGAPAAQGGGVFGFAGDGFAGPPPGLVPVDRNTPAADVDLKSQRLATGPDGSVYIVDADHDVVLRVDGDGSTDRVAGTYVRATGPHEGQARDIELNLPAGIDVDVNGNVYFAEWGSNRIRKLEPTGNLVTVGEITAPADVKVGEDDVLYVASKDGNGMGGVSKLEIDGSHAGVVTSLLSAADVESIAIGPDNHLYVAAREGPSTQGPDTAYVCKIDLAVPGDDCRADIVQRQAVFPGGAVGPQFPKFEYLNGGVWEPLFPASSHFVVGVDVGSDGAIYMLYTATAAQFWTGLGTVKTWQMWGGNFPMVYRWLPGTTEVRLFGQSRIEDLGSWIYEVDPLQDGTPGTDAVRFFGTDIAILGETDLLVGTWDGSQAFLYPTKTLYRIDDAATSEGLFFGTPKDALRIDMDTISLDDFYYNFGALLGGAITVVDDGNGNLQSLSGGFSIPAAEGGPMDVVISLTRNQNNLMTGTLYLGDGSVGLSAYGSAWSGNYGIDGDDVWLELFFQNTWEPGSPFYVIDLTARDSM